MARKDQARMAASLALTAAALALAALTYPLQAGGTKSDSKVKVKASAAKPAADGKQTVTLTLDISPGWYIYANPVNNEDLSGAQTTVQVFGKEKSAVQVNYPAGKTKKDTVVGNYNIYENMVAIPVTVQHQGGGLEIGVKVQACSKNTCLQPATIKVKVE